MDDETPFKSKRTGRCKDARGRSVTVLDPYMMHRLGRHAVIPAEPLASIARRVGFGWAKIGRIIFFTVWPVCLVCLVIAHFDKRGGGLTVSPRELRLWIVLAVLFVINIVVVWIISRSLRLARVCKIMLEHRRCPHCGYDLRLLPAAAADGATVCPECGCAWKLEKPGSSEQEGGNDTAR